MTVVEADAFVQNLHEIIDAYVKPVGRFSVNAAAHEHVDALSLEVARLRDEVEKLQLDRDGWEGLANQHGFKRRETEAEVEKLRKERDKPEFVIGPGEDSAVIPEIKRTWERAAVAMPPSDPADPDDPSVNLDTLAAIAHAKWTKLEACQAALAEAEAEVEKQGEALRFYADETNYDEQPAGSPNTFGVYDSTECPIFDDRGEFAREALAARPETADERG